MCRCIRPLLFAALVGPLAPSWAVAPPTGKDQYPGIGRTATAAEVAAWDIDVRPDFKGLPPGSGSVAKGQVVWDGKCASCHGTFGESNEVFTPIAGGTTKEDARVGRVKALREPTARSTLMKVSTISTLWDYINRAMPWNAPKSLSVEEVYASVAYILYLGDLVPADYVLSEKNIAAAQNLLPNRLGKTRYEGLWDVRGKGDVRNIACMTNCRMELTGASPIASFLPDFARNAHGNLAEQQRRVGPSRGTDTTVAGKAVVAVVEAPPAAASSLAKKHNCLACHAIEKTLVGPGFAEVAAKYRGDAGAPARLAERIRQGSSGVWGAIPMPANATVGAEHSRTLAAWILAGAPPR